MELIKLLHWRYATKQMNGQQVAREKLDRILEAARLAPTSNGLQPFEIIRVQNQELKEMIRPIAFDQPQITSCSDLLVFAAWDKYTEERVDEYLNHAASVRQMPATAFQEFRTTLITNFVRMDEASACAHAAKQAYLALGVTLIAAAAEEVDSTPMEGFQPDKLDAVLGMRERGLRSVALLALGYREATVDWLATLPKVRRHRRQIITEML